MKRAEWQAIKAYIDAKIDEEIERASDKEPGVWCGEPALHRAEREIEQVLED